LCMPMTQIIFMTYCKYEPTLLQRRSCHE
jgi:hypothetical protein